jgi:hypothetical protein
MLLVRTSSRWQEAWAGDDCPNMTLADTDREFSVSFDQRASTAPIRSLCTRTLARVGTDARNSDGMVNGELACRGRELTGSSRVSPIAVHSQIPSVVVKATVDGT